ncbi:hypothetical protein ABZ686_28115 [Streptomyces sp. NPDC006992]|uniref:hypothetical protein n=1 Tax=Streptomyces sp. NPDC006992 TaxID=3155601 RepID=UPI0033EE8803
MPRLPDLPKLPRFPQSPEPPRLPGAETPSLLPGAPGPPPGLSDAASSFPAHPYARTPADRTGHPVRWDSGAAEGRVEEDRSDETRRAEEDGQVPQDERRARQHGGEQRQPHPREEQPGGARAGEQEKRAAKREEDQEKRAAKREEHRRDAARQRTAHRERDSRERHQEKPPGHGEGDPRRQRQQRQQRQQENRINPPNHRAALRPPASFGNVTAPPPSGQAIGKHDLYAPDDPAPQSDEGRRDRLAAQPSGQVLPVLPLGTGLTLMGLGLAFLALRVRRGG